MLFLVSKCPDYEIREENIIRNVIMHIEAGTFDVPEAD